MSDEALPPVGSAEVDAWPGRRDAVRVQPRDAVGAVANGALVRRPAIYLTTALIADPHLPSRFASAALFGLVCGALLLLAVCRVLAGVHHPSDVVGGACAGVAWAFFIASCFA